LFGKTSWMLQQLCSKEKQDYCSVRKDTEMDQLKNWQDTYFVPVRFVKEDTKQPVVEEPSISIILAKKGKFDILVRKILEAETLQGEELRKILEQ